MIFNKKANCKDSIVRTIRFSGKNYDFIKKLSEKNNITFNNVVNQIIEKYYSKSGE